MRRTALARLALRTTFDASDDLMMVGGKFCEFFDVKWLHLFAPENETCVAGLLRDRLLLHLDSNSVLGRRLPNVDPPPSSDALLSTGLTTLPLAAVKCRHAGTCYTCFGK